MAAEFAPCPLCGEPLYPWVGLPARGAETVAVGEPLPEPDAERIIVRCEHCGVAVEQGRDVELGAEWEAVCRPGEHGHREISIPDRNSVQAAIGVGGWAAIDLYPGRLIHTRRSLELLAERNGTRIETISWPSWGPNQAWMWQTLLNGLTFHPNFAREVRAGRLHFSSARSRGRFIVDTIVTVLGAPLVALVSFPMEAVAALAKRGGRLEATARRTESNTRRLNGGAARLPPR
jgi:hypothetical protein